MEHDSSQSQSLNSSVAHLDLSSPKKDGDIMDFSPSEQQYIREQHSRGMPPERIAQNLTIRRQSLVNPFAVAQWISANC